MIILRDFLNNRDLSRHRTLRNAILAKRKHAARLEKAHPGSFISYVFWHELAGAAIDASTVEKVEHEIILQKILQRN